MNPLLFKYQRGFIQRLNAQHCLIPMLEKWRNTAGKGKVLGVTLTDLSKIFDSFHMNQ